MIGDPQRTPDRVLRFALRCGDAELADLLARLLGRDSAAPASPLAARTYARLESRLGIAPTH